MESRGHQRLTWAVPGQELWIGWSFMLGMLLCATRATRAPFAFAQWEASTVRHFGCVGMLYDASQHLALSRLLTVVPDNGMEYCGPVITRQFCRLLDCGVCLLDKHLC